MNTPAGSRSNHPARRRLALLVACALLLLAADSVRTLSAPGPEAAEGAPQDTAAVVARGEYLANEVAMCVQCHSPRDQQGQIVETEKFRGGAIPVRSPYGREDWAFSAPSLRGLVGLTDEQALALLMTGTPTGRPAPKGPMPPFRLSRADADAIVAYLRTR